MNTASNKLAVALVDKNSVRTAVNSVLEQYFLERIELASTMAPAYADLWHTIKDLGLAGGKRLRPYMVMLAYSTFGGKDPERVLPVGASWELLHLCMLIHDDIIDNDLVRYGVPNIAGAYQKRYSTLSISSERKQHLSMSAALLAGDVAHSAAHEILITSNLPATDILTAQKYLTAATFTVAGGELLDTEASAYPLADSDTEAIAEYKTANYSFVGPLCTGAALAGATPTALGQLQQFGTSLGLAFQLTDDLLGVFGDEVITGKSTIGDLREGKPTYMMQYAFEHADQPDRQVLDNLVGNQDLTEVQAINVREILVRTGARQAIENRIDALATVCLDTIEGLGIGATHKTGLRDLVTTATKRNR